MLVLGTATVVVLVHGYDGSGPGHWQRWVHAQLLQRGVASVFPELPDPQAPRCDVWVTALAAVVAHAHEPVILVAHSLGCWAVDHLIARCGPNHIAGALLVAPPSPYLLFEPVQSFFPPPRPKAAWAAIARNSLLVGSDNDAYIEPAELEDLARTLGVPLTVLPGAAHINIESGFGPWPFALEWVLSAATRRVR